MGIVRQLTTAAQRQGVGVRTGQLAFCNSVNADCPEDAFQVAFAYLRARGVSELTLAPVEQIVQDALLSPLPAATSSPVVSPQR